MKLRAFILVAVAVACGESTTAETHPALTVTYQRTPLASGSVPDSAAITSAASTISIDGKILTGDGCEVIKGDLVVIGDRLQVTVRAESTGALCFATVARFGYTATITGVAPGTWAVDVRHLIAPAADVASVATQTVVVQ